MTDNEPRLEMGMVLHILQQERYPIRFEDLCIETFRDMDQTEYVRTSRTYDLGKDARSAKMTNVPPIICCGTGEDPVTKAEGDLKTILKSVKPLDLLFCFTDATFTEHKAQKIEAHVRAQCPSVQTVRSFGGEQLSQLIVRFPRAFEEFYAGDLANLRRALAVKQDAPEHVELTGLRIALTTQLNDSAQERRRDVVRNLILTALSGGNPLTLRKIAKMVSDRLHLPKIVSESWLQLEINELQSKEFVTPSGHGFKITDGGKSELGRRTSQGTSALLKGQTAIRQLIEELTGAAPSDGEFNFVWGVLENNLVAMFVSHGVHIIESVVSIASGESVVSEHDRFREHVQNIAATIAAAPGGGGRIQEVAQAIEDMFYERESAAFEWLIDLAEVFLHMCALGLEPSSQNQIVAQAKEISLVLDTDIVLSLLSSGESNHQAIKTIVEGWHQLGGEIYVCDAALEEASHHAHIAERDFEETSQFLDTISDVDARHLIENVFVRGFRAESVAQNKKCTKRRWGYYISAYRGKRGHHDFDKILEHLEDLGIKRLVECDDDQEKGKQIAVRLYEERKAGVRPNRQAIQSLHEKCERDGRTGALIVRCRNEMAQIRRTAVIVSTSRALRRAVELALDGLSAGGDEPVWYAGSVAWVLAQIPGVRLSAGSLRAVLFDVDFPIRLDPLERQGLRILQVSEEFSIHYSRRATLKRALRDEIRKRAESLAVPEEDIERDLHSEKKEDVEKAATLIASAVDRVARSESEKELGRLRSENQK